MDKILDALQKYQLSDTVQKQDKDAIDNLIKIIELSIYNRLRYADIMSHLKVTEFQLISKAYKFLQQDKELDVLNNLFNKKCSI